MKVAQIYDLVNTTVGEVTGKTDLVNEDLTNIVDVGKEIIDTDNVDNYVKKLVNHIGKVVFSNKVYNGSVPSVLMDSWEFGSILEKVTSELPQATESDSWKLTDGQDYSPDIFYQPKVSAKFFNKKVTFEIPLSFTELQVKESFSDINQLNGFISMLNTSVQNAMTVRIDDLTMQTINNMTAETISHDLITSSKLDSGKTTPRAINLVTLFNEKFPDHKITKIADVLTNSDFIKFATYTINVYKDRLSKISTLFNVGGKERFTTADDCHLVLLSDFANSSKTYVESDTYNNNLVQLPTYETVPYWQGSGSSYDFADITKIDVKTASGSTVNVNGILGVMFDTNALGVSNLDKRVTTNYNPKAEFYTNFYKLDAGYFNDLNENFILFYVGLPTTDTVPKA